MSNFTEMDCYLFGQATHYDIYHRNWELIRQMISEGEEGVFFSMSGHHMLTEVYVIGEPLMTGMRQSNPMRRVRAGGELEFLKHVHSKVSRAGSTYTNILIITPGWTESCIKQIHMPTMQQVRPGTASRIVTDIEQFSNGLIR